jgi:Tfp pilus assembly protein PilF
MRRLFSMPVSLLLMLAATAAGTEVANAQKNGQSPGVLTPGVTITGKPAHAPPPLPKLPPDEFTQCFRKLGGFAEPGPGSLMQMNTCIHQQQWEEHTVLEACINPDGKTPLPRVIQGCTESLDRDLVAADERYLVLATRGEAYFASGDPRHALEDYGAAIKLTPHEADLYYNRGVVFAAQSNDAAASRDFDTAVSLNPKFVPALRQRGKIETVEGHFSAALADYTEAIRLEPKAASLWSERGYVDLRDHGYESAVEDEARAIKLDPRLARAYYLRSVAFGNLGDRVHAVSDLRTAVGLDPSLAGYVTIRGKTVSIGLPPL